jgi:hypothetical protein
MLSLQQIEADLKDALKSRNQIAADTLRGLKTRIQNEKTAKGRPERSEGSASSPGGKDLEESEIVALVRSEVKRRKEAAEGFKTGNRMEMAEKELSEAQILEKYLPAQMSEADLSALIDKEIAVSAATAKDFGKVMGKLKAQLGDKTDGATLAKLLKEKLK